MGLLSTGALGDPIAGIREGQKVHWNLALRKT